MASGARPTTGSSDGSDFASQLLSATTDSPDTPASWTATAQSTTAGSDADAAVSDGEVKSPASGTPGTAVRRSIDRTGKTVAAAPAVVTPAVVGLPLVALAPTIPDAAAAAGQIPVASVTGAIAPPAGAVAPSTGIALTPPTPAPAPAPAPTLGNAANPVTAAGVAASTVATAGTNPPPSPAPSSPAAAVPDVPAPATTPALAAAVSLSVPTPGMTSITVVSSLGGADPGSTTASQAGSAPATAPTGSAAADGTEIAATAAQSTATGASTESIASTSQAGTGPSAAPTSAALTAAIAPEDSATAPESGTTKPTSGTTATDPARTRLRLPAKTEVAMPGVSTDVAEDPSLPVGRAGAGVATQSDSGSPADTSAIDPASLGAGPQPTVARDVIATATIAPPVAATPQSLADQLVRPILTLQTAPTGSHVLTINVAPESLGPVTVQAHLSSDGIRVELIAPTDQAREALKAILPDLKRDLSQGGMNATLSVAEHGGAQTGARQDAAFQSPEGKASRPGAGIADPERARGPQQTPVRAVSAGGTSLLDVFA
ncbi:MAG: flagellar hook-length control protein FliK [Actinomycetota bacterium]|nr:flagellar hook-length control protein FliK [Actinomycetota bacterium]